MLHKTAKDVLVNLTTTKYELWGKVLPSGETEWGLVKRGTLHSVPLAISVEIKDEDKFKYNYIPEEMGLVPMDSFKMTPNSLGTMVNYNMLHSYPTAVKFYIDDTDLVLSELIGEALYKMDFSKRPRIDLKKFLEYKDVLPNKVLHLASIVLSGKTRIMHRRSQGPVIGMMLGGNSIENEFFYIPDRASNAWINFEDDFTGRHLESYKHSLGEKYEEFVRLFNEHLREKEKIFMTTEVKTSNSVTTETKPLELQSDGIGGTVGEPIIVEDLQSSEVQTERSLSARERILLLCKPRLDGPILEEEKRIFQLREIETLVKKPRMKYIFEKEQYQFQRGGLQFFLKNRNRVHRTLKMWDKKLLLYDKVLIQCRLYDALYPGSVYMREYDRFAIASQHILARYLLVKRVLSV